MMYSFETYFGLYKSLLDFSDITEDYVVLDYVYFNNTRSCMMSDVKDAVYISTTIQFIQNDNKSRQMFGYNPDDLYVGVTVDNVYMCWNASTPSNIKAGGVDVLEWDLTNDTVQYLYVNGNLAVEREKHTIIPDGLSSSQSFTIGGLYSYCYFNANQGDLKLYDKDMNLIADYISVKRKSDDAVGMLDRISGQFITKNTWVAGDEYVHNTYNEGDVCKVVSDKCYYVFDGTEWKFWYKEHEPIIFNGITFEEFDNEAIRNRTPIVFKGITFEEFDKKINKGNILFFGQL